MKIAYFSPIPFDGLKQRPQYLAEGLTRSHEVFYVDPTVSIMKYLLKGGEKPFGFIHPMERGLTVIRLNGTFSVHRSLEGLWKGFGFPEHYQLKSFLRAIDLIWIGFSPWYSLLQPFPGRVVFDWMDDNAQLTENRLMRRLIYRIEPVLARRADWLFVTAQRFYDQAVQMGLDPIFVPNAVDRKQATISHAPVVLPEQDVRVFGYVGMISHWFDLQAVRTILQAAPENRVVLVGPEEIARLEDPRVQYVGRVPKEQVGSWIASFDVCLYPFQRGPLLNTINPVKLYEYLAQNKPVLAVRCRETDGFGSLIYRYETEAELKLLAAGPLSPPFSSEEARIRFLAENTWESRVKRILGELENGRTRG